MVDRFLPLPEVKTRTRLSRATIYARQKAGTFPKAIQLGPRTVGWLQSEIDAWIADRVAESRNPLPERTS